MTEPVIALVAEIARLGADNERLTQLVKELHKTDGELRAQIKELEDKLAATTSRRCAAG